MTDIEKTAARLEQRGVRVTRNERGSVIALELATMAKRARSSDHSDAVVRKAMAGDQDAMRQLMSGVQGHAIEDVLAARRFDKIADGWEGAVSVDDKQRIAQEIDASGSESDLSGSGSVSGSGSSSSSSSGGSGLRQQGEGVSAGASFLPDDPSGRSAFTVAQETVRRAALGFEDAKLKIARAIKPSRPPWAR